MQLHCVYRSTASENRARRPDYYSKDVALASFLRSVEHCDGVGDLVFVNDGSGFPPERLSRMRKHGEVLELPGLGNGGSFRYLLTLLETRSWAADDVVYFAEDDYLYTADAFSELRRAAETLDAASFFTLYDHPDYQTDKAHLRFQRAHSRERWSVGPVARRAVRATTMSFGARVGDMRACSWIFFLGTNDHPGDWYIWDAAQSVRGRALIPMLFRCFNRRNTVTVNLKRCGLLLNDYLAQRHRGFLVAPEPSLATHLHMPFVAPNVDWAAEAMASSPDP